MSPQSWLDDLTWTCHVCGRERPDEAISVYKTTIPFGTMNVRYCNDNPSCVARAPYVDLTAPSEAPTDDSPAAPDGLLVGAAVVFIGFVLLVFVLAVTR